MISSGRYLFLANVPSFLRSRSKSRTWIVLRGARQESRASEQMGHGSGCTGSGDDCVTAADAAIPADYLEHQ